MKIVVTGNGGQVVTSLVERATRCGGIEVLPLGRPVLDLAEPSTIADALAAACPDLIVSAAAYTAVDNAEDEPDIAYRVNGVAPGVLAREASRLGVRVIQLSTDYVFSGDGAEPYRETDETGPQSVYGASKRDGELAVLAAGPMHLVVRTAWVYSPFGTNFVKTMLRLAADRDEIRVVGDQFGSPTSALDIADGILSAARRLMDGEPSGGLFHLTGTGYASWADLAREVFVASARYGGPVASVRDIATSDYPTKAKRPANSRLASTRFLDVFGYQAPAWQESVDVVVRRLLGVPAGAGVDRRLV